MEFFKKFRQYFQSARLPAKISQEPPVGVAVPLVRHSLSLPGETLGASRRERRRFLPGLGVETNQLVQDVDLHGSDLTKLIRGVNKLLWKCKKREKARKSLAGRLSQRWRSHRVSYSERICKYSFVFDSVIQDALQ